MDEFKPEDELRPDPSDRRTGRSRQSADRDNDPQINFDDVELEVDEPRSSRGRKVREEATLDVDNDDIEDDIEDEVEEVVEEPRPRKRKAAAQPRKPASRQYLMMALGIVVLLVLLIGIGSALKSPSTDEQGESAEKSISLSGESTEQVNTAQPVQDASTQQPQDVSVPPIASMPTEGQTQPAQEGQQRVELQGDLGNALTQEQSQVNNTVANSTLPTAPATVASVQHNTRTTAVAETSQPARQHTVIEPKPVVKAPTPAPKPVQQPTTQTKPVATTPVKPTETAKTPVTPTPTTTKPATTPAPSAPATAAKSAGDVIALTSAPASNYTLQLSSSSNYNNLDGWAKQVKLKDYVVYETKRNGKPWYVLVSGIYASKDEAKRAVATLPVDVQAKNPWTKPLSQVQSDLK